MEHGGEALGQALEFRGRTLAHRLTVASDMRNHIVPFFQEKPLARITPEDIERYIAFKQRTLSIKTIRNHVNTIHSSSRSACAAAGA
ncbi:MAG: tyrosine-type recombinase/integrase [Solirubrobacteraceae bacterium]